MDAFAETRESREGDSRLNFVERRNLEIIVPLQQTPETAAGPRRARMTTPVSCTLTAEMSSRSACSIAFA